MPKVAPEIARLDRLAARMGVPLQQDGASRTFALGTAPDQARAIKYRLQGKGAFLLEAYLVRDGQHVLEASTHCGEGRIEQLLMRALRLQRR